MNQILLQSKTVYTAVSNFFDEANEMLDVGKICGYSEA